jgi:hypothetical protein
MNTLTQLGPIIASILDWSHAEGAPTYARRFRPGDPLDRGLLTFREEFTLTLDKIEVRSFTRHGVFYLVAYRKWDFPEGAERDRERLRVIDAATDGMVSFGLKNQGDHVALDWLTRRI